MGHRLHLLPDLVGVRLRGLRDRLLLPGHRGLARRHREGHRDGHHGVEDGVVAARSCRPPRRRRDDPSLRCRLPIHLDRVHGNPSLEGIAASIGSVGDAYDNALAETTIGLFKTEAVGRGSPFLTGPLRIIDDVEYATMEWVDWFNNRRLHSVLDYVPPEEYETAYYAQPRGPSRRYLNHEAGIKPGTV